MTEDILARTTLTPSLLLLLLMCLVGGSCGHYQHYQKDTCSNKLENALDHMVQRNRVKLGTRIYLRLTPPYPGHHSLYGEQRKDLTDNLDKLKTGYGPDKASMITVEVADLNVRLPQSTHWVLVNKCHFSGNNRTLDSRLMFPDLTISGNVIIHPMRGKCRLILRLRKTTIEFRTLPLMSTADSWRNGVTSVRTDSHFTDPGFLTVFAHSCQPPSEQKFHQNSKQRHIYNDERTEYVKDINRDQYVKSMDILNFNDSLLDFNDFAFDFDEDHARMTLFQLFGNYPHKYTNIQRNQWHHNSALFDADIQITESLSQELEQVFNMGVRSLLTSYMQKILQPPIKETLMENMGYTISYG